MKLDTRVDQLEKKVVSLLAIVEKQNETIATLDSRLTTIEQSPKAPNETSYKPLFDRWPGNVG